MEKELISDTKTRESMYRFLAEVFLIPIPVPGCECAERFYRFARSFELHSEKDDDEACRLKQELKAFCDECENSADLGEVQKALAIDRTRLCRGTRMQEGITPPLAALFLSEAHQDEVIFRVVRHYAEAGMKIDPEAHERVDYLGVELSFLADLTHRQWESLEEGDAISANEASKLQAAFLSDHVAKWVPAYCALMKEKAQTSFFRALALMLSMYIREEEQFVLQDATSDKADSDD